jgi:hypothetical protein
MSPGAASCVTCPTCGFDYSHIREVFTRPGCDPEEGASAYPGTQRIRPASSWRRPELVIVFDGECGHAWEMQIQQHKGQNLMGVEAIAP